MHKKFPREEVIKMDVLNHGRHWIHSPANAAFCPEWLGREGLVSVCLYTNFTHEKDS